MSVSVVAFCKRAAMVLIIASIAACAAPTFDPVGVQTSIAPWEVAGKSVEGIDVIWGGVIVQVHHFESDSEVEVLAFPLDRAQRPIPRAPSQGRFRIRIPGYVESVDFPEGLFLSARGHLVGTRDGKIGEANYVFPIIADAQIRRWPPGFQFDQTHWSVGVGIIL